jgi:hypothetical protein
MAEAIITLAAEQEFAQWIAQGTIWRSWALTDQNQEEGIAQMRQG